MAITSMAVKIIKLAATEATAVDMAQTLMAAIIAADGVPTTDTEPVAQDRTCCFEKCKQGFLSRWNVQCSLLLRMKIEKTRKRYSFTYVVNWKVRLARGPALPLMQ